MKETIPLFCSESHWIESNPIELDCMGCVWLAGCPPCDRKSHHITDGWCVLDLWTVVGGCVGHDGRNGKVEKRTKEKRNESNRYGRARYVCCCCFLWCPGGSGFFPRAQPGPIDSIVRLG